MKYTASLVLVLAATVAADPEAAGALKLTRPDQWTRQEAASIRPSATGPVAGTEFTG